MWRLCLILASLGTTALGQNVIPLQEKESDISSSIAPIVKAHHQNPNDIITNKHLEEIRELFENNDVFKSKLDNILSKISNSITSQILSVVRSETDKEHVKIVEDVEQSGRRQQLNNEISSTEAKELASPLIQLPTKVITIPVEESKVKPIKVVKKLNHDENHVKKEKDKKLGLFDRVRTILGFRRVGQNNKKHESSEEAHNHRRSDTSVEQLQEVITTNLPILPNVIENDKQNVKDVNDVTNARNILRVLRDDITNQDKSVESQFLSVKTNNLPTRRNVIENDKHDVTDVNGVTNGIKFFTALRGAVQATRSAIADSRIRPRRMKKRDTALQPVLNIFSRLKQPIDKIVQEEKSIFGFRRSKKPEGEIPHNVQTSQRRSLIPIDIQSMRTHVNNTNPLDILVAKNNNPLNRLFGLSNRQKRSPDFDDAVKAVQNAVVEYHKNQAKVVEQAQARIMRNIEAVKNSDAVKEVKNAVDEYHKKQAKSVEQAQARLLSNIQAVKDAVADIRNNTRRSNIRDIDIAHSIVPSTEILHNDPNDSLVAKKDNPISRLFSRSNRQKRSPDLDDAVKAVKNAVNEYHKNQAKLVEQAQARIMRNIEAVKNSDAVKEVKNAVNEYHKKQAKSVEQAQARLLSNIQAVKNAVADIRNNTRRSNIRDIDTAAHSIVPSTEILHNNDEILHKDDGLAAKKDNPISRLFNRSNRQKRSPDLDDAVKAVKNAVNEYHKKQAKSVEQAQARIMRNIEAVKNSDAVKEVKNAVVEYHKKQAKSVEQAQARLLRNIQAVKNAVADIRNNTRRSDIRDIAAHSIVPSAESGKQDRSKFNLFIRSKRSRDLKVKVNNKPVFSRRRVNKPEGDNVQPSKRQRLVHANVNNDPHDILVAKKDNAISRLFNRSNRQKRSPDLDDAVKAVQNAVVEYHKKQAKSVEQAQARLLSNIQAVKNAVADIRDNTRRSNIRDIDIAHSVVPSTEIPKQDRSIFNLFSRSKRSRDVKIKEDTKPVFGRRRVIKPVGEIPHNVQTSQRRSLIPIDIQSKHDNDPDILVAKKDNAISRLFNRSNRQKRSPAVFDDALEAIQNVADIEQNIDDILDLINNKPSEVFLDQFKMKKNSPKSLTNIIKTDELEEIFKDQQQEKLKRLIGKTIKTVISPLNTVSRLLRRRNSRSNRDKTVKEKILSYTITDHKVYDDYEI